MPGAVRTKHVGVSPLDNAINSAQPPRSTANSVASSVTKEATTR
jgi:hypothetical protein